MCDGLASGTGSGAGWRPPAPEGREGREKINLSGKEKYYSTKGRSWRKNSSVSSAFDTSSNETEKKRVSLGFKPIGLISLAV